MKWSEVIGQDEIKAQLDRLIISNRVPHAQLFTGDPGYGGLPLAIEFALSILNDNNNMHLSRKLGKNVKILISILYSLSLKKEMKEMLFQKTI